MKEKNPFSNGKLKKRFKMYKAGKRMLVAPLVFAGLGFLALAPQEAKADTGASANGVTTEAVTTQKKQAPASEATSTAATLSVAAASTASATSASVNTSVSSESAKTSVAPVASASSVRSSTPSSKTENGGEKNLSSETDLVVNSEDEQTLTVSTGAYQHESENNTAQIFDTILAGTNYTNDDVQSTANTISSEIRSLSNRRADMNNMANQYPSRLINEYESQYDSLTSQASNADSSVVSYANVVWDYNNTYQNRQSEYLSALSERSQADFARSSYAIAYSLALRHAQEYGSEAQQTSIYNQSLSNSLESASKEAYSEYQSEFHLYYSLAQRITNENIDGRWINLQASAAYASSAVNSVAAVAMDYYNNNVLPIFFAASNVDANAHTVVNGLNAAAQVDSMANQAKKNTSLAAEANQNAASLSTQTAQLYNSLTSQYPRVMPSDITNEFTNVIT